MNLRVLNENSCSQLEADLLGLELTDSLLFSDCIVNPQWCNLVGKVFIINLPTSIELRPKYNKIRSRIPIKNLNPTTYELIPYDLSKKKDKSKGVLSKFILSKHLLQSRELEEIDSERFMLGTEIEVDGYLTAVGYNIN